MQLAEFAVNRFGGDADKATAVYAGVAEPLTDADVADSVVWAVTRSAQVHRVP
jgi:NADP-dependent 3-hydroxy acid dehydrogenase YdfG